MKKVNINPLQKKRFFLTGMILSALLFSGCSNSSVEFLESELEKEEIVQLTPSAVQEEAGLNDENRQTEQVTETSGLSRQETGGQTETGDVMLEEQEETSVYVYVCGAVVSPGVYEMEADSRVFQAVEMAGGVLEEAAPEYVNQAMTVADGQQIYIPSQDEVSEQEVTGEAFPGQMEFASEFGGGTENSSGKVNINTADKTELMTISGIGESRAQDIIAYREEHGGFSTIDEIMNVPGIKEATFEKIKDGIEVK